MFTSFLLCIARCATFVLPPHDTVVLRPCVSPSQVLPNFGSNIDHDDGSAYYNDSHNALLDGGGWVKHDGRQMAMGNIWINSKGMGGDCAGGVGGNYQPFSENVRRRFLVQFQAQRLPLSLLCAEAARGHCMPRWSAVSPPETWSLWGFLLTTFWGAATWGHQVCIDYEDMSETAGKNANGTPWTSNNRFYYSGTAAGVKVNGKSLAQAQANGMEAGSTEQNFDVLGLDGLLKMIRTLLSF